jgi:purine-binding chemotaxis protein CheW
MSTYVTFGVAEELYALPVTSVVEIAPAGDVAPVPRGGPGLLGVRHIRGVVMPVFCLATVVGNSQGNAAGRDVVIEHDGVRACLAVDSVEDVGELGQVEDSELPLLSGASLVGQRLVGVLDIVQLLEAIRVTG